MNVLARVALYLFALLASVPGICRAQDCRVLAPENSSHIVHGPYPQIEELSGTWIGGIQGEHERRFLRVTFDCSTPERVVANDSYALEFTSGVIISGRDVIFAATPAAGERCQFNGFVDHRVMRGTVRTPRGESFFHLEREIELPRKFEAFEGLYDTGPDEWLWILRDHDNGWMLFDQSRVSPLHATNNETFLSLGGEGAILILDTRGNAAQAWLGDWNEESRIAIKRPMYDSQSVDIGDGTTTWTATLLLPARVYGHPAMLVMPTKEWPELDVRLHAHEIARRETTVLVLPGGDDLRMAEAGLKFLQSSRDVNPDHIGLLAFGENAGHALGLLEENSALKGAAFVSPPPAIADELTSRTILNTRRGGEQHLFTAIGAKDERYTGRNIPSLPERLYINTDVPHSNLMVFENGDEWLRKSEEGSRVIEFPENYFEGLRGWVGRSVFPPVEEENNNE